MKPSTLVAIAGVVASIAIAIEGAVLSYVVKIEHRLTRVETLIEPPIARTPFKQPAPTPTQQRI
jgi:hypothetical protein